MTVVKKTEMEVVGGQIKKTNVIIFLVSRRHTSLSSGMFFFFYSLSDKYIGGSQVCIS